MAKYNQNSDSISVFHAFPSPEAEFFFECVEQTVNKILPEEMDFLTRYDRLNHFVKHYLDMPDKTIDLLIRFLHRNDGRLSKRALNKEFSALTDEEVQVIENKYADVFDRVD